MKKPCGTMLGLIGHIWSYLVLLNGIPFTEHPLTIEETLKEGEIMKSYEGAARKITRTLFLAQSVVSAALITTATINSIAGADLSGVIAWAGFPATVFLLAAALGAYTWGLIMERLGRRVGLVVGLVMGAVGGFTAAIAILRGSFPLFLIGMGLYGFAHSAMQLGRFAAAEVNPAEKRGRAIATVVLGGTA